MDKELLKVIMDAWDLNAHEKKFIEFSNTAGTADMNQSRVLSEFLLTKQIKISTKEIIESNKLLSDSENKHSKNMQWLTWALIAIGILQAIAMLISLLKNN